MDIAVEKTIAILQPGYLPWLGFFEQFWRADLFIFLDDVQYTKGDWRNRNRIKTIPKGLVRWLTVPVRHQPTGMPINDAQVDYSRDWVKRHLNLVRENYNRTPFFKDYFDGFKNILEMRFPRLVDLCIASSVWLAKAFAIDTPFVRSSDLQVSGARTLKLINLCKSVGGTAIYDGSAARCFIDQDLLDAHEIKIRYQDYRPRPYRQAVAPFTPFLSAIDLLMNCGSQGKAVIIAGGLKRGMS